MCPTLVVYTVVQAVTVQLLNLPQSVFSHIPIFVNTALPPLLRQSCRRFGVAVVHPGLHQVPEAAERGPPIRRHIDDILQLQVIQQKSVHWTVVAAGEVLAEPLDVQATQASLALEHTAHEMHLAAGGEQIDDFLVEALVEVIPVGELQLADRVRILEHAELRGQPLELVAKRVEIVGRHRDSPSD